MEAAADCLPMMPNSFSFVLSLNCWEIYTTEVDSIMSDILQWAAIVTHGTLVSHLKINTWISVKYLKDEEVLI